MAKRAKREMSVEEFDEWCEAKREVEEINDACAEEGGPRVSLVPEPTTVPLDVPPDQVSLPVTMPPGVVPFTSQPSRKAGGWSAERQRIFIETLAETGMVHLASKAAGLSARSAYALRIRSPAFARAMDTAQQLAACRLATLAFDRAIHGRIEQIYQDGELVAERRVPSEGMHKWLLARLDPARFALPWERRSGDKSDPQAEALEAFPAILDGLTDTPGD